MISLSRIRTGYVERLARFGIVAWLGIVVVPCICAAAQAHPAFNDGPQVIQAHHDDCHDSMPGSRAAKDGCCTNLTVQAIVDPSDRSKLPDAVALWSSPVPADASGISLIVAIPVHLPGTERAPPVYLATQRLRI